MPILGKTAGFNRTPPLLSERETNLSIEDKQNSTVFPLLDLKTSIERSSDGEISFFIEFPEDPNSGSPTPQTYPTERRE
jgi:hypothetical protein